MNRKAVAGTVVVAALALAGCSSQADTANYNLSKEAENFQIPRKIVGVNMITDREIWLVEGKCSIETEEAEIKGTIEALCKVGPDKFKRFNMGPGDNVTWFSAQLDAVDVDEYRTTFIIKPEQLIPNFDMLTSGDPK